jgi:hypothetical protein
MDRRTFTKTVALASGALLIGPQSGCASTPEGKADSKTVPNDYKKIFWKKGACSTAMFYILNREFGHPNENEEGAAAPLAGGLMLGYQCGMLWGSSLAVGAESFRKCKNCDHAIGMAISSTQNLLESFTARTKSANCRDIINADLTSKLSMAKCFLTLKFMDCFNLMEKWAPEAIKTAYEGLSRQQADLPQQPLSCASEVAKKMGASEEEMVTVAGFAGGLGLSGNACGALSAAIWMKNLAWYKKNPGKSRPPIAPIFNTFRSETESTFLCNKITGQNFKTIADHTTFIKNGGCSKLINILAQS